MIKEAIEKILSLAKPEMLEIDGLPYSSRPVIYCKPKKPRTLNVSTLDGLTDLADHELLKQIGDSLILHVNSPTEVTLTTKLGMPHLVRYDYAKSLFDYDRFRFGGYMPVDEFIVFLSSRFAESEDRDKLICLVGNVRSERVLTSVDDGISQQVTARKGVATVENITVDPIVSLRPVRTFPEIDQPECKFIFRMRQAEEGDKPGCALFECDGSGWELTAIDGIYHYLLEWANDNHVSIIR